MLWEDHDLCVSHDFSVEIKTVRDSKFIDQINSKKFYEEILSSYFVDRFNDFNIRGTKLLYFVFC